MAKIDDYTQALELGIEDLVSRDPEEVAGFAGAGVRREQEGRPHLSMAFLNRMLKVSWPGFEITFEDGEEVSIQQRVLIVHYLGGACRAGGPLPTGEWVAYQEIPDGRFYLDAFQKRAKNPLVQGFGERPEPLLEIASLAYGADPFDYGDVSVTFTALPRVPMALILWKGDDEFPPEGNILFDRTIASFLSAEDIAWLAGMAVYPLIGMLRARTA